jgi:hypothetical protein
METFNFKRAFLVGLILALILSAIVGIYIFIKGEFGELENKILITTGSLSVYSLLGLCSALEHGQQKLRLFSVIGMILSLLAFIFSLFIIWQYPQAKGVAETFMLLTIFTFSFAHMSLLFLLKVDSALVKYSLYTTFVFIIIVALMLSFIVIFHYEEEIFFKFLGVFAILDALGSIVTPLLHVSRQKT